MVILLTMTGVSLLSNTNRKLNLGLKTSELSQINPQSIEKFLREYKNKPEKLSAEVNSILKIEQYLKLKGINSMDTIHLFLSDTEEMHLVKTYLHKWLRSRGYVVKDTVIKDLNYKESRFKMNGLRQLVAELSNEIRNYQKVGNKVFINATGGFKVEAAYATLTGQMFQIETFYLYECFEEIIPLPTLPLDLTPQKWVAYRKYLRLFHNGIEHAKADEILKRVPEEFRLLIEWDNECNEWVLNTVGELIWDRCRDVIPVKLDEGNKRVVIKRGETTLWHKTRGRNVNCLDDIPDVEVRKLLKRALRFSFVQNILLVDYHKVGKTYSKTSLQYINFKKGKSTDALLYCIKCKDGKQNVNIIVDSGKGDELIEMYGTNVYL